jgi:hypothetical protein
MKRRHPSAADVTISHQAASAATAHSAWSHSARTTEAIDEPGVRSSLILTSAEFSPEEHVHASIDARHQLSRTSREKPQIPVHVPDADRQARALEYFKSCVGAMRKAELLTEVELSSADALVQAISERIHRRPAGAEDWREGLGEFGTSSRI